MSHKENITRIKVVHNALGEWIGCHLEFSEQRRVSYIIESLSEFITLTD